ncbi:ran protein binding protein [Nannochloropsis gaditana]|uniref:Ran protein binding protein n=1 Tax=Nannochloropsis gaditana TaxID=72520 RepID=W7TNP9_9STRA|nr:ran protein binding protein [Nannochloropsis gaditana]
MASTKSTKSSSETRNTNSGNSSSKCVTNSSYVKKPTPEKVGRRFVLTYYPVMSKSAEDLIKFYKEDSCFSHVPETEEGQDSKAAVGLEEIRARIEALNLGGAVVDIRSVDVQPSKDGAVLVLVQGLMRRRSAPAPSAFVQTFFLAQQENNEAHYYLLNDVFRAWPETPSAHPPSFPSSPGPPTPDPPRSEASPVTASAAAEKEGAMAIARVQAEAMRGQEGVGVQERKETKEEEEEEAEEGAELGMHEAELTALLVGVGGAGTVVRDYRVNKSQYSVFVELGDAESVARVMGVVRADPKRFHLRDGQIPLFLDVKRPPGQLGPHGGASGRRGGIGRGLGGGERGSLLNNGSNSRGGGNENSEHSKKGRPLGPDGAGRGRRREKGEK